MSFQRIVPTSRSLTVSSCTTKSTRDKSESCSARNGWGDVLEKFEIEYIPYLRKWPVAHVVLLIDFDAQYEGRRKRFDDAIPADLKNRVFVVGAKETPEALKQALKMNFEKIGGSLAEDCYQGTVRLWSHELLSHNEPDRLHLVETVRSIVFPNRS